MVRSEDEADRSADRTPSYWAAMAAALVVTAAIPAAFAQAPPIEAAAQAKDGVLLEADTLVNDEAAQTVTAEGDVEIRYQGRTLKADRLTYNLTTGEIHAQGHVEIAEANGSVQYADEIQVDEALNLGFATELRARFGPEGALAARSAVRRGEGRSELRRIIYTSCPICESGDTPPTWSLRARRAVQDQDKRMITYSGAVLEVTGVPVLYLPYFGHPDPTAGAHSGLLTPDLGSNRRLGAFYEQPYLWAISPYSDMVLSARAHANVAPLFGLEYRKRFWSGDFTFATTVTQEQDFDGDGNTFGDDTTRSSFFASGRFDVNEYWNWGFGAERTSDDQYLRRYDVSGAGDRRGPYVGTNSRLISQLFAIGQDARSYSAVSLVSIQGIRDIDTADQLPLITPYIDAERVYQDPWLDGQLRVTLNSAVLQRDDGRDSARASFGGSWRRDAIFGPGIIFSPFAQARGDLYDVEVTSGDYQTFTRTVGLGGAEISWPFMRPGENVNVVIEPVAMGAIASEGGDDARIINEDSLGFELDDSNLFRPNGAPNYDLWEPGARLSLGVRATARARTGQSASLLFGRRWRDEELASSDILTEDGQTSFSGQTNLNGRASDWVAALNADMGRNFGIEVRTRLEDESLEIQRIDADVRAAYGRYSAHARYFSIDEFLAGGDPAREILAEAGVDLARGWRLAAGLRRDLDSDINLRQEVRAIYEDECTFLEIAYTRSETQNGALGPSEGIQIRVGLRSLGVIGGSGR